MTIATTEQDRPADEKPRWARKRGPLGHHVARTIGLLQKRLLEKNPRPEAVAALAGLRRAIGREPGYDYTLDAYLAVPAELLGEYLRDDQPDDAEYAKHAAVTLYALHQQSQREPMHAVHRGLGQAIAALTRVSSGPEGIRRRFAALGTAATYEESLYHLRSLIVMLREHHLPLDYGLLADDLKALRRPGGRAQMQAMWGREFYRTRPSGTTSTDTEIEAETESAEETTP